MLDMYPSLLVEHQGRKLVGYPHVSYLNACLHRYGHQTMLVALKDIMLDACISPIIDGVQEVA